MILLGTIVGTCTYINKTLGLPDDNLIEETIENKIEDSVGLDIDLTPDSPEKN